MVDEVKEMKEHLDTLADTDKEDDDKEFALEELSNMCDRIDMAKGRSQRQALNIINFISKAISGPQSCFNYPLRTGAVKSQFQKNIFNHYTWHYW